MIDPRRRALPLLAALLVLCATGCSLPGRHQQQPPKSHPQTYRHYVALGDTFTAAPDTGKVTDRRCRRSAHNYPARLADELRIHDVQDVSCDQAPPGAVVHKQKVGSGKHTMQLSPQVEAVSSATDLVTIGLGAYQQELFKGLVAVCGKGGGHHARRGNGTTGCTLDVYLSTSLQIIAGVRQAVDKAIRAVQDKSPDATVVLIGYPRHVTPTSRCTRQPRLTKAARKAWMQVDSTLNTELSRAARDTGATFVDVYGASRGHQICAHHPWVHGDRTTRGVAVAFGPTSAEQAAVARLVVSAVRSGG